MEVGFLCIGHGDNLETIIGLAAYLGPRNKGTGRNHSYLSI
jgi:hypothetical protein